MKNTIISILCACSLLLSTVQAQDEMKPRQLHSKQQFQNMSYDGDYLRVVMKFHDGSGVRSNERGELMIKPELQDPLTLRQRGISASQVRKDVVEINRYLQQRRLSSSQLIEGRESRFAAEQTQAEQYWQQEMAELPSYQQVLLKDGGQNPQLPIWVRTLNTFPSFEIVYAEPVAYPGFNDVLSTPPVPWASCNEVPIDPAAGDLSDLQGYLGAPPVGMNADLLHQLSGGQGSGIRVIDVEGGYHPHSDHKPLFQLVGHTNSNYTHHGNAVIGIIGALHNGIGLDGMAPEASIGFRSIYNENLFDDWAAANTSSANVAHHLYWAGQHSMEGVVLIELQRPSAQDPDCVCANADYGCIATPVEYWPAEFDVIQQASGNGVVYVEAAGNGSRNLDSTIFNTCGGPCFDRNFRDSGAILVSGSLPDGVTAQCAVAGRPNYGTRVDVHSWSEGIPNTTNIGLHLYDGAGHCNDYSDDFGGTSGASAIIAGAVTSLQGAYLAETGNRLTPEQMREALNATGTPQTPLNVSGHDILIGPHPDLVEALQYALEQF